MTDLILAVLHHVLVFALVGQLAMEAALLRPGMTAGQVRTLTRIDAGYGATSVLVVLFGALRVWLGAKGWDWYAGNHWFWGKMVAVGAIGLLSVPPTLRYLGWARRQRADAGFTPEEAEIRRTRRWLGLQALLLVPVLVFAATMARYTTVS